VTSLSSSTTHGTAGFRSTATASKTPTTSTSTGGSPVATGGFVMGIGGAAGILGLTLVLGGLIIQEWGASSSDGGVG
jgi:hypothetical protein